MNIIPLLSQFSFLFLIIIGALTVRHILFPVAMRFLKRRRFAKRGFKAADSISVSKEVHKKEITPKKLTLRLLQDIEWKRFEHVCCAYFVERGLLSKTTKVGADGGVDIELFKKGADKPTMIAQCKAYSSKVGVKDVREFYGVIAASDASSGIFMTTNDFTKDALSFAKKVSPTMQLCSGDRLIKLIEKLPQSSQDKLLAIATEGDHKTPTCASCDVKMVKRKGKNNFFYGCVNFPRCRMTMKVKA